MSSWFALDTHIHDGRNPNYRKLANNTVAIRRGGGIAVRLHKTDVLTFHDDRETVTYDTGGWLTVTTKSRFNDFGPDRWNVWADSGTWTLYGPVGWKFRYFDGMRINPDRQTLENESDGPDFDSLDRRNVQTRKLITGYVKGLTDDVVAQLLTENGRGDCLYCQMSSPFGSDHLESHLRERYFMPNLLLNAYRSAHYAQPETVLYLDGSNNPKRVRVVVGKYLRSELLENVAVN